MIESPPKFDVTVGLMLSLEFARNNTSIDSVAEDINNNYLYWNKIKYITPLPNGIRTPEELWTCVKMSRRTNAKYEIGNYRFRIPNTSEFQRLCHEIDLNCGGMLGSSDGLIPESDKQRYLISSNMEEAIASSIMEGAATTRLKAKEMLQKKISPRTRGEKMIVNNYNTIRYIIEHKDLPASKEMLLEIHKLITRETLENAEDEGRFRQNNDVVVENGITHETIYTPPSFEEIDGLIESICTFFNQSINKPFFIHPVIRGIILHFLIAFVHPFADGNGRTARAVFYWYMLHQGYWLTEYLSISSVIKESKHKYEDSFLYTEKDDNDLGYFIHYNLHAIDIAYRNLRKYIERKMGERQNLSEYLHFGINERQAQIIGWFKKTPNLTFSVKEIQTRLGIAFSTAKSDLDGLAEKGFLKVLAVNKVKHHYVRSDNFLQLLDS